MDLANVKVSPIGNEEGQYGGWAQTENDWEIDQV